jgi:hypothetical protein
MSARKFSTLTPALQFSFPRHPMKTTSLRTEWGNACSRRNCFRHGRRFAGCNNSLENRFGTRPHRTGIAVKELLSVGPVVFPLFKAATGLSVQAEFDTVEASPRWVGANGNQKEFFFATFEAGMLLKTSGGKTEIRSALDKFMKMQALYGLEGKWLYVYENERGNRRSVDFQAGIWRLYNQDGKEPVWAGKAAALQDV